MTSRNIAATSDDVAFASFDYLTDLMTSKKISSEEITKIYLARIARFDDHLHAYSLVFEEEAILFARAADDARAAGRTLSPLHGIPVAIKDIFDYAGFETGGGSNALAGNIAATNASVVSRLQSAGMVVLGKTHMVEFAFGGWGTNPVKGTPWNPWDLETHRVPGGSSSGSAVAVAAGLAPAALGTDTGGSVRTPACWCGVVGLKTSSGLISRKGVLPLSDTHDTVGPLARTVRDTAYLLQKLVAHEAGDPTTISASVIDPLTDLERGVEGIRIGILADNDLGGVEPEIHRLLNEALKDLEGLGAHLVEFQLPLPIDEFLSRGGDIMSAESYAHWGSYIEKKNSPVTAVIQERIMDGKHISAATYLAVLRERCATQSQFLTNMDRLDAVIVPACHQAPIRIDAVDENTPPNLFGRLVNYLDLASVSVPIGLTQNHLPAGMQIMVRQFDDALALRIARAFERSRGEDPMIPAGLGMQN